MEHNLQQILDRALTERKLSKDEIIFLLSSEYSHNCELITTADQVRKQQMGDEVHLRGIIEFSNHCERNCRYCGLRQRNLELARYRMTPDEIYKIAADAHALGYRTVVLQSGEDSYYDADMIAGLVRKLKKHLGIAVTLSCGERPFEEFYLWRKAGADRYLIKHETADPGLYKALHPDMAFSERRRCLLQLRELGYQVGSGCMVGLPGQTLDILAADLLYLQELDVEMAGIGPFIPNPSTPLAAAEPGSVELTLKMIAIARLLMPQAHLPATTALGTLDPQGRQKALRSGGNVVMPNVTPNSFRRLYEIYPNKICLDDNPGHCRQCIGGIINSLGRTVAAGEGHSPKRDFRREAS